MTLCGFVLRIDNRRHSRALPGGTGQTAAMTERERSEIADIEASIAAYSDMALKAAAGGDWSTAERMNHLAVIERARLLLALAGRGSEPAS